MSGSDECATIAKEDPLQEPRPNPADESTDKTIRAGQECGGTGEST